MLMLAAIAAMTMTGYHNGNRIKQEGNVATITATAKPEPSLSTAAAAPSAIARTTYAAPPVVQRLRSVMPPIVSRSAASRSTKVSPVLAATAPTTRFVVSSVVEERAQTQI